MALTVNLETTTGLKRRMTVAVPNDEIEKKVDKKLKEIAPKVRLPGFRPGKVPPHVLRDRFGLSARAEVLEELVESSLKDAIEQKNINIAGRPEIELVKSEPKQSLEYIATFEVLPTIDFKDFADFEFETYEAEFSEQDVNNMLEKLRKQHIIWEHVDRPAEKEDQLIIDFKGTIDGKPFEGGSANDFKLVLGSGSMIPGFEDQLMGAKPNETRVIDIMFPTDYHVKNLAGKQAQFEVTIKTVQAGKLPELNDEFANQLDEEGGLAALKENIEKQMQRDIKKRTSQFVKHNVLKKLFKENPFEIPECLIEEEYQQNKHQALQRYKSRSGDTHHFNFPEKEKLADSIRQRLAYGLMVRELVKKFEIKVDEERVNQEIEGIADAYNDPSQVVAMYHANDNLLEQINLVVTEEQVIEKILEQAKLNTKKITYDEVMKLSFERDETEDVLVENEENT